MPNFIDFADSFYAPQMWGEGYEFWPYVLTAGTTILAALAVISMKRIAPHLGTRIVTVSMPLMLIFLFTGLLANQANWSIAKENVMEKYDVSSMVLSGYALDEEGITDNTKNLIVEMVHSSGESSTSDKLFFVFKDGENEPFLMRQDMTDEEFEKVEKMILKKS